MRPMVSSEGYEPVRPEQVLMRGGVIGDRPTSCSRQTRISPPVTHSVVIPPSTRKIAPVA